MHFNRDLNSSLVLSFFILITYLLVVYFTETCNFQHYHICRTTANTTQTVYVLYVYVQVFVSA